MNHSPRLLLPTVALALAVAGLSPSGAHAATTYTATASFRGGSGNYEATAGRGTDGLRPVSGTESFTQTANGPIRATGAVTGLAPNTLYVTVPYVDPYCTPVPGVTAFPSGSWQTDGNGSATFSVSVSPTSVNPVGNFTVNLTRSVSIRQVIVSGVQVPGYPIGTPTLPNVSAVETCDEHPAVAGN